MYASLLLLDGKEELELRWQFFLRVKSIGEVNSSDPAIGVDGHSQGLNVVAPVSPAREVRQIELNLIPPLIQSHGHSTDKGLDSGSALVVGGPEPTTHVFVIEHLNLKGKIFFELNGEGGTFLMIMTKKGSLMPSVSVSFCGQVMKAVVTLVPMISRTEDWMSWSVMRLMWPLWTEWRGRYSACPRFEAACCRWSRGSTGNPTGTCS